MILLGNCLDKLSTLIDNQTTVQAIITDPPYATNKGQKPIKFSTRKDIVTNFGEWDQYNVESFKDFTRSWLIMGNKVLEEGGNIAIFSPLEKIGTFIDLFEETGFKYQQTIIWHKVNPTPRIRKTGFLSSCEGIVWAYKSSHEKTRPRVFNFTKQNEMHNFVETPIVQGRVRTKHPTQKPKVVIDKLVTSLTKEGDVVLDPFIGSGTTAVSCYNLNRKVIGIEFNIEYYEICKDRLKIYEQR